MVSMSEFVIFHGGTRIILLSILPMILLKYFFWCNKNTKAILIFYNSGKKLDQQYTIVSIMVRDFINNVSFNYNFWEYVQQRRTYH